jgi:hypothetical protein
MEGESIFYFAARIYDSGGILCEIYSIFYVLAGYWFYGFSVQSMDLPKTVLFRVLLKIPANDRFNT